MKNIGIEELIKFVEKTRAWAVKNNNCYNGKDYAFMKKRLTEKDYNNAKTLYYLYAYRGLNNWDYYCSMKNNDFTKYIKGYEND